MIESVKSPSTLVLSKGRRALWLVVLLTFAALVLAAGAQARGTNAPDAATEAPIGEAATESGASPERAPPPATEQTPPAVEATSPTAEAVPPPAEQAPVTVEESPPAAEQAPPVAAEPVPPTAEVPPPTAEVPPPTAEVPPPTAEVPPPTAEVPPPTAEVPPPVVEPKQAPPVAETVPPTTVPPVAETAPPAEKKTVEQASGGLATGADSEGLATQRTGESSQVSAGASGPTHEDAAGEVAPAASIAATAPIAPGVPSGTPTVHERPSLASLPRTITARRDGQASCESVAIEASIAADDAGDWLDLAATASASTTNFAAVDTSPTANTAGAPAGSHDGGPAVENHPSAPTPGPGPGGAGGGSAAGGGSGSASSASFTLVGALLHAAPHAIRRFRLAQPSWRTSFFVLIPERPD
jgi:hypothetical protein